MKQEKNNQLMTISVNNRIKKILNLKENKSGFIRHLILTDFYENKERYKREYQIKNQIGEMPF